MAVIQEAFDIPADIMTKLLTGEYRRIGGVVRYAVGPQMISRWLPSASFFPSQALACAKTCSR